MVKLSKSEEQLMDYIWQSGKAFMKDLIGFFPDPKPAATTIATLLKRMADKGVIGFRQYGNSREYFPLIEKSEYFSRHVGDMVRDYFDNSALQFASFFTRESRLTRKQLEELKKIVEEEIQKKKR